MQNKIFVLNHKAKGVVWWDFLHETTDEGCSTVELVARITKVENTQLWFQVEFIDEPPAPLRKMMRFRKLEEAKSTLYSYLSPYLFNDTVPAKVYARTSHQYPGERDYCGLTDWN